MKTPILPIFLGLICLSLDTPAWGILNQLVTEIQLISQNSGPLEPKALHSWFSKVKPFLSTLDKNDVILSLESLAKLKKNKMVDIPDDFILAVADAASDKLHDFNPQELSRLVNAFSLIGIYPGERFLEVWQNKAQSSIEEFKPKDLSESLYALSLLGFQPGEPYLDAWRGKAQNSIESFGPSETSTSISAFSNLGIHPGRKFLKAWKKRADTLIYGMWIGDLHQTYLSLKFLSVAFSIPMPKNMMKRFEKAFPKFKSEAPHTSRAQTKIYKELKKLYPEDLHEEYWIDATASYVDFAVPSSKLIIQFDGPHHFLLKGGKAIQRPQDQMMDAILRAEGWTVFRVNYQDWIRIQKLKSKKRITELKRLLGLHPLDHATEEKSPVSARAKGHPEAVEEDDSEEVSPVGSQKVTLSQIAQTYIPVDDPILGPNSTRAEPSGLIWGDRQPNQKNQQNAFETCLNLNPPDERRPIRTALETGNLPAGGFFLPRNEDWAGIVPDALPNLVKGGRRFWTSSHPLEDPATGYYYDGRKGTLGLRSRNLERPFRCVGLYTGYAANLQPPIETKRRKFSSSKAAH